MLDRAPRGLRHCVRALELEREDRIVEVPVRRSRGVLLLEAHPFRCPWSHRVHENLCVASWIPCVLGIERAVGSLRPEPEVRAAHADGGGLRTKLEGVVECHYEQLFRG